MTPTLLPPEIAEIERRHASDDANEFTRRFFGPFHQDRATLLSAYKALLAAQSQPPKLTEEERALVDWLRDIAARTAKGVLPNNIDGRSVMRVVSIIDRLTNSGQKEKSK